jgi:hypothetical protein
MNGQFEEVSEEVPLMLEEFYPETDSAPAPSIAVQPLATRLTSKSGKPAAADQAVA